MAEDKQDALVRAFATLSALRKNVDQIGAISEKYVREFHTVLDRLESIGIDVSEFRIPHSEITPHVRSVVGGVRHYSEEKYVDRAYMLTKMDAILGYFEIITSDKPRKIGFTK